MLIGMIREELQLFTKSEYKRKRELQEVQLQKFPTPTQIFSIGFFQRKIFLLRCVVGVHYL